MRKRRLQKTTCFALGMVGAGFGFVFGVLQAAGFEPYQFLRITSFIMYGAMLLFLATTEKGVQNRTRRLKLLLLFAALLVGYFPLPLLCPLLDAFVMPLFGRLHWLPEGKSKLPWRVLVLCEAVYLVVRSIMIMPSYATLAPLALGLGLALVSAARLWLLFVIRHKTEKEPQEMAAPTAERLRVH